ncbi:putative post-transcriptional transactivator [Eptesicus fuscus gammaherpesvirus]|uniref:Post-transcriptional transactivator n=1 Tax=vespertilionid gammaherpesvirus 3 TaxID=2846598 RepID=A0A2D0ZNZ2_9GAMA|nr:putative post-transcriptional transactivator [Eptesicus fuscus gammaherpesvirus]ATA58287.1 putative post-transcriptional transactivator [Eptesicus fuscus gammaherpesvirus]WAH70900.1 mRNA export factor ICP27-like protein [Eptesicus fuscus gammaherpesvirus]
MLSDDGETRSSTSTSREASPNRPRSPANSETTADDAPAGDDEGDAAAAVIEVAVADAIPAASHTASKDAAPLQSPESQPEAAAASARVKSQVRVTSKSSPPNRARSRSPTATTSRHRPQNQCRGERPRTPVRVCSLRLERARARVRAREAARRERERDEGHGAEKKRLFAEGDGEEGDGESGGRVLLSRYGVPYGRVYKHGNQDKFVRFDMSPLPAHHQSAPVRGERERERDWERDRDRERAHKNTLPGAPPPQRSSMPSLPSRRATPPFLQHAAATPPPPPPLVHTPEPPSMSLPYNLSGSICVGDAEGSLWGVSSWPLRRVFPDVVFQPEVYTFRSVSVLTEVGLTNRALSEKRLSSQLLCDEFYLFKQFVQGSRNYHAWVSVRKETIASAGLQVLLAFLEEQLAWAWACARNNVPLCGDKHDIILATGETLMQHMLFKLKQMLRCMFGDAYEQALGRQIDVLLTSEGRPQEAAELLVMTKMDFPGAPLVAYAVTVPMLMQGAFTGKKGEEFFTEHLAMYRPGMVTAMFSNMVRNHFSKCTSKMCVSTARAMVGDCSLTRGLLFVPTE